MKKYTTLEDTLIALRYSLTQALKDEAKKQGLTLSYFEVIKYVAEAGNPSMKDIAKELHITPPSVSALVDILVKKRLLARSQKEKDRRTIRVTLTPKAQKLLSSLYQKKTSVFNKMLSKLNKIDKNELARIIIKCITINK